MREMDIDNSMHNMLKTVMYDGLIFVICNINRKYVLP